MGNSKKNMAGFVISAHRQKNRGNFPPVFIQFCAPTAGQKTPQFYSLWHSDACTYLIVETNDVLPKLKNDGIINLMYKKENWLNAVWVGIGRYQSVK